MPSTCHTPTCAVQTAWARRAPRRIFPNRNGALATTFFRSVEAHFDKSVWFHGHPYSKHSVGEAKVPTIVVAGRRLENADLRCSDRGGPTRSTPLPTLGVQ